MMPNPIVTGWLRVPPARSWRAVATGPEASVRQALDAATRGLRLVDAMILPAGEVPDSRRRDGAKIPMRL